MPTPLVTSRVTALLLGTGLPLGTARVQAGAMSLATVRLAGLTPRLVTVRLPAMVLAPDTDPARITVLVTAAAGATVTERVRITGRVPAEVPRQGLQQAPAPDPATAR